MAMQTMEFRSGQCERRREFFAKALDAAGVDVAGRQKRLCEMAGITPQISQSVCRGNLPRDGMVLVKVADAVSVNIHEWVTGTSAELPSQDRLRDAITIVRTFARETDIDWTDQDFAAQVLRVLDDPPEVTQRAHKVVVDLAERRRETPTNKN